MKTHVLKRALLAVFLVLVVTAGGWSQTVPYVFANNSAFADANVYVALVGIKDGAHVWLDCKTSTILPMSSSYNTVTGPTIGGNTGPGGNSKYAACFTKLSDIPDKTINVPMIEGCRIFISFNSQLYLYFFGSTGATVGYAAPNLANPTDPNQGIRYEIIELTYGGNGMWSNTTRVDSYQYPMGLEVWGNNSFYKKVGELKSHDQIIALWKAQAPSAFQGCLDANNVIHFPSKVSSFSTTYFNTYVDQIWAKYASGDLVFNAGDAGTWRGRTSGNVFTFTRTSDGQIATISNKPSNLEVMEGSGVMAQGGQWDKVVQAQVCAAINRHAIDLTMATGATQYWSDETKYYQTDPYNWYCKFWHQTDVSYNGLTYAFCYDDVFDKSSTINCPSPIKAVVTIGGFYNTGTPVTGVAVNPASASIAVGGTQQLTATVAPSNATNTAVTWSSSNTAIATVSSSGLVTGVAAGTATITVTTQDGGKTATSAITVTSSNNLALNKTITVSSTESASYAGSYAVDGNSTTRWSSAFTDPQWIYVDLGANYAISRVKISWEAAYGKDFLVQVSTNASTWTTLKTVTGNTSLSNDYTGLSGTGRYLRIYGTARGTVYGYSIYELEVYGTAVVSVTGVSVSPTSASLSVGATQQLTATVTPSNATNTAVIWNSSNTSVATVNSSGLVTAVATGSATITVSTQDGNKTATSAITVTSGTNLALNKTTTVSSTESASYAGSNAVDGSNSTRWSSAFSDPQWIYVDLGASYDISRVKISWEAAYGKDFLVQVSADAYTWTTLKTVTGNTSVNNDYTGLSGTGRYVRIYGTARGTVYGYSIYELEVYGTLVSNGCSIANASGDYSVSVSTDASNPTITFIPARTGVGSPTCILYYSTTASGTYPGYTVTANSAYRINAAAGTTVYFYYTYSVPEGGERNTVTTKNSFTVGNCGTLKDGMLDVQEEVNAEAMEAYPVPMTDELTVRFAADTYQTLMLTDIAGKIIRMEPITPNSENLKVNVSDLKKGAYILNLVGEGKRESKIVVK